MGCRKLSYYKGEEGLEKNLFFSGEAYEKRVTEQNFCNNYYPFGLQHDNSWTRPTDLKNNFLYNAGSELNEQTKNYETFCRDYDPALGRFNQIDPLASSFSSWNPYQYAFNDPVALNDPNGDYPTRMSGTQELHNRLFTYYDMSSTNSPGGRGSLGWSNGMTYGGTRGYDGAGGAYNAGRAYRNIQMVMGDRAIPNWLDLDSRIFADLHITDYYTNGIEDAEHYIHTEYSWSIGSGTKHRIGTDRSMYPQSGGFNVVDLNKLSAGENALHNMRKLYDYYKNNRGSDLTAPEKLIDPRTGEYFGSMTLRTHN